MDYKYINQLLERYWRCETSLEEEDILRSFFSQKEVPVELLRFKDLFTYEQAEKKSDTLGEDFDRRLLAMTEDAAPVKARTISMAQRLRPIFKAAAMVAIILTLGNALQVPFADKDADPISQYDGYDNIRKGTSIAMTDSAVVDSMKRSIAEPQAQRPDMLK